MFITLSYEEGTDVWHINESYVETALEETAYSFECWRAIFSRRGIPFIAIRDLVFWTRCARMATLDDYEGGIMV